MNTIELLIADNIKKIDSTLDLQGSDRKMLQLACKDFTNYMKFNAKTTLNLRLEIDLEKFSKEKPEELGSFLSIWTAMWMKKWQARVKLFIGVQNKKELTEYLTTFAKAEPTWQKLECKQELIDVVLSTLINNGEICGTENMAEYTLKTELTKNNLNISYKTQALTFLNNVMHRAHQIAKTAGPLMFVEVNKAYYSSVTTQKCTAPT
ncbi:MAG: hypothetical protein ABSD92_11130 [Candidatus Bathyarchaeia archaeon]|jgi:hypothetical protein